MLYSQGSIHGPPSPSGYPGGGGSWFFPGVKLPGLEADYSPFSAVHKSGQAIPKLPNRSVVVVIPASLSPQPKAIVASELHD